jgi:hypothetical protein
MSGRLVGEVAEWLCTPAAAGLTAAERVVLLVIAERANEKTREMWRHRADTVTLAERLRLATGMGEASLSKVFKKLADRGLEVRVPLGVTENGRTVFSCRGRATRFHLPLLPASVELPECFASRQTNTPVDNQPQDASEEPGEPSDCFAQEQSNEPNGLPGGKATAPNGLPTGNPYPSTTGPSNEDSSCSSPKWVVEEEGDTAPAETPEETTHHMGWDPSYHEASGLLQTLPDLGGEYMTAAEHDLPAGTPLADRVIYAARLAKEAMAS